MAVALSALGHVGVRAMMTMSKEEAAASETSGPSAEAVATACHAINGALAALLASLEFMTGTATGELRDAVEDAQLAAKRISTATAALRRQCGRATPKV